MTSWCSPSAIGAKYRYTAKALHSIADSYDRYALHHDQRAESFDDEY